MSRVCLFCCPLDLASTFIPFDDDEEEEEEEEEETYDDIERNTPPPRITPVSTPTASHGLPPPHAITPHRPPEVWKGRLGAQGEGMVQEEEDEEEEEDIYEVLPGSHWVLCYMPTRETVLPVHKLS